MRSHRHLDQVGPLSLARFRSHLARIAIIVPGVWLATIPSFPQNADPLASRSKGSAKAPVTVYEMADFQCPACRTFTVNVMPALDKQFVQSGKVRWVFINLPLVSIHPNAMAAAEVAMCASRQGRFWETHDVLYYRQAEWAKLPEPRATLMALAQRAGVDRKKLVACLDSGTVRTEVEQEALRAVRSGANATPSFYIEGGLLEGAPSTPEPMVRILDSIYTARTRANQ
ncbi:MAG TPA: thioredoxin domain-containing protein [Gemmatimonadales bacterium]|nr:thioredoxin domain-containing protein [Gemmatimonadales bacterium]